MGGAIGAFIAFGQTYGKEASGTLAPATYWGMALRTVSPERR